MYDVEVVLYLLLTYVLPGECPSLDCWPAVSPGAGSVLDGCDSDAARCPRSHEEARRDTRNDARHLHYSNLLFLLSYFPTKICLLSADLCMCVSYS